MPSNEDLLDWLLIAWGNKEHRRDQLRQQVLDRMEEPANCEDCSVVIPRGQGLGFSAPEEQWADRSKPRPITIVPLCLKCMSVRLSK